MFCGKPTLGQMEKAGHLHLTPTDTNREPAGKSKQGKDRQGEGLKV